MDEQKVNQTLGNATAQATGGTTSTTSTTTTETGGANYGMSAEQRAAEINRMYDANRNAQTTALQEAGDQALSDAQANRDKIAQTYQTQRNASAIDYERRRRNFLEGANMNGINTGAGSQAQLAFGSQQARDQGNLGVAQANAEVAADRNIADIRRNTQANINEAIAKNDYQRAAALLDEYNTMYNRAITRADTLSKYGDFSGYASIYGAEEAQRMANNWYAQDPNLAYMMGAITTDQRDNLLNNRPINDGLDENGTRVVPAGSGGGGGAGWKGSMSDALRYQLNSDYYGTNGSSPNTAAARGANGVITQSAYDQEMRSINRT